MSRPAPGGLELVRGFLNTVSVDRSTDELAKPGSYLNWITGTGLPVPDVTDGGRRRAAALRDGLRGLVATHSIPRGPESQLARTWAGIVQPVLHLDVSADGSVALAPATVDTEEAVLASLLCHVAEATVNQTWRRLKLCQLSTCRWAFYDASPARSAAWCTMAVCGARHKARTYRQRRSQSH